MTAPVTERAKGLVPDASTFGTRLAMVRQVKGWGNVAEAAKATGLPVETWRSWERDNREPHRLTVVAKQIAAAAGIDYLWLVHGPDRGEGGGEVMPTGQYAQMSRLIASVGDPDRTVAHPTRPVRRTRPTSTVRPFTPTAA